MSPPSDQLVRDYLNRLSVAARGRLSPDDRRALVDRTRYVLQNSTEAAGLPSAVEVARLLSGLGDPVAIVEQERERLAAMRGEQVPSAAARARRIAKVLRREPGWASWHWPSQPATSPQLGQSVLTPMPEGTASPDPPASGEAGRWPRVGPGDVTAPTVPRQSKGPDNWLMDLMSRPAEPPETTDPAGPPPDDSMADDSMADDSVADDTVADDSMADDTAADDSMADDTAADENWPTPRWPRWPSVVARSANQPSAQQEIAGSEPPEDLTGQADAEGDRRTRRLPGSQYWPPIRERAARLATGGARLFTRQPVECVAVLLLGLGGAIYPPVWLLGAATALASRLWDYRDKWTGLAIPVLLTVLGTAIGVASAGGRGTLSGDVHAGWVVADVLSRVSALLGACYLGWRVQRGKRPPAVPPWHRQHHPG